MYDYHSVMYRGFHIKYLKKDLIEPKFAIYNGHSYLKGFKDPESVRRFINWMYSQGLVKKPVIEAKKEEKKYEKEERGYYTGH